MLSNLFRGLLLAVYNLVIVSAVLYFGFWTSHRDALLGREDPAQIRRRLEPPRHIDLATMRLLGAVRQSKDSSFLNFEQAKPVGSIRVCALGDSNTQGDEVGERHDYPSYLQRMFRLHGFHQIQVLNFGNGWYGFSQIYVMWKNVASKFGCDYVTLLPMNFWEARDTTFSHTGNLYPGYIHARLVLTNDGLRLIPPIGETAEQRLQEYVRPIPHWQYLRFDRHPPNIFEAPLPGGRTIPNPFYYDRRAGSEEASDIHARVIRAIANDGPQLVVVFRGEHKHLYPKLISARADDMAVGLLEHTLRFPYRTPARHPSSWGQELTAMAFFELLTGGTNTTFPLATIEDVSDSANGTPEPLHNFKQVWLTFRGERAGYFVARQNRIQDRHDEHLSVFRRHGIAALLTLATPGGSIADSCLLPLRDVPTENAELIFMPDSAHGERVSVGAVHQLQPGVAIFKATVPAPFKLPCWVAAIAADRAAPGREGRFVLNNRTVATIKGIRITPDLKPMLDLRDSGEFLASTESLAEPGVMEIALQHDDGTVVRRPLLTVRSRMSPDYLQVRHPLAKVIDNGANADLRTR